MSDILKTKWTCNYCDNIMMVPELYASRIIDKSINNYRTKRCRFSLLKIRSFAKMSYEIEKYLETTHPDIFDKLGESKYSIIKTPGSSFILRDFLWHHPATYISTGITCYFCKNETCEFHLYYGGFSSYKCGKKDCNERITICGWCEKSFRDLKEDKVCATCYQNGKNKEEESKEIKSLNLIKLEPINLDSVRIEKKKDDTSVNKFIISDICNICFVRIDNSDFKYCCKCRSNLICGSCYNDNNDDKTVCSQCKIIL